MRQYLLGLTYNPDQLLQVEQTTGAGGRDLTRTGPDTSTNAVIPGIGEKVCTQTPYNLKQNFSRLAILRPASGVIWPGALVKANANLRNGAPDLISLPRGPVTFAIDLPGFGSAGAVTVTNPTNSSVQVAIDNALQVWNRDPRAQGYVNPSNSSLEVTTAYESKQTALDLNVAAEWSSGSASGALAVSTSNTTSVVTGLFMQTFYTITIDQPTSPETVLDPSLSLDQVQQQVVATEPPAYVHSVSYGRIIMVRMETANSEKAVDVEAAFQYAGGVTIDANLVSTYERIIRNSTFTFLQVGGSAQEAVKSIDVIDPFGTLLTAIVGDAGLNALYSPGNPGVPIAYEVKYLKDNSLAKMGFTTDYKTTECGFKADQVQVTILSVTSQAYPNSCGDGVSGFGLWWEFHVIAPGRDDSLTQDSTQMVLAFGQHPGGAAPVPYTINWAPAPPLNLDRDAGTLASIEAVVGAGWFGFPNGTHSQKNTIALAWDATNGWNSTGTRLISLGSMGSGFFCDLVVAYSVAAL